VWGRKSQFEQNSDWVLLHRIQGGVSVALLQNAGQANQAGRSWGTDRHLYIGWDTFRLPSHSGTDGKVQQELLRDADIRTTMNVYTQAGQ
jgi:hypothetical protein